LAITQSYSQYFHVQTGAAWFVIFEYCSLFLTPWRHTPLSFMSAHVCSQLTTKARRNRRRSFNFSSCIFRSCVFWSFICPCTQQYEKCKQSPVYTVTSTSIYRS